MPQPLKQKAVYKDLFSLPENMTGEIIEGDYPLATNEGNAIALHNTAC